MQAAEPDTMRCSHLLLRLLKDESGQDLVEYAILAAALGLATYGAWAAVQNALRDSYGAWNTNQQNLWEPPDPGA
jgi:Flp pilus assembly pilin Flp